MESESHALALPEPNSLVTIGAWVVAGLVAFAVLKKMYNSLVKSN